jgi:abortive infection bacteriophage resistance protein
MEPYFYTYMNYSKQALNINQQIEQLPSRGLIIEDTNISFDKREE